MKYLFLAIAFFICLQHKAQTPAVDSLLKVLKTAKEDTNKVNHLNNLSRELIYQKPNTFTLLT